MKYIEKKQQLFSINIFMLSNLMTVPKSVSVIQREALRGELTVLLLLTLDEPQ